MASTAAAAARKGNADARAVLAWQSNFLVGRFLSEDRGFNPRDGAAYLIATSTRARAPLRSWAEIGAQTRAQGWSNENGWSKTNGNYAQLALSSLAAIIDVLKLDSARRAYAWLLAANPPFTRPSDFARDPLSNITPATLPRVPSRAGRCT